MAGISRYPDEAARVAEIDRRKLQPPDGEAMLPWYGGAYATGFVALHPFFTVEGLDPARCEYGTLVLPGADAPRHPDLLAWVDRASADRRVGKELGEGAVAEAAKRLGRKLGWRTVRERAGFEDHLEVNRALLTSIMSLTQASRDEAAASRLIEHCAGEGVFLPSEGRFQPIMENGFVELFERIGCDELVIGDEFGEDERPVSLSALRTVGTWSGGSALVPFKPMRLFSRDASVMTWVHWDSFSTVILADEHHAARLRPDQVFEGFWCSRETSINWLTQPCLPLAG